MKRAHIVLMVVAAVLLLVGGSVWAYRADQSPTRVFDDMLANNLSTNGVTRVASQKSSSLSVEKYTQLSTGEHATAHALITFKYNGSTIVTEEISNPTNDYVRYSKLVVPSKKSGKSLDTSSVVGKWAKLGADDTLSSSVTNGLFDQTELGILPVGNLEPAARATLLNSIHENGTFTFDAKKVTVGHVNGRKVYQYAVSVKPSAYVALMQQYGKLVGANEYASFSPNDYAGTSSLALQVSVDAASHQLAQIYQPDTKTTEQYRGFGVAVSTTLPHATLSTAELEKRIAALQ